MSSRPCPGILPVLTFSWRVTEPLNSAWLHVLCFIYTRLTEKWAACINGEVNPVKSTLSVIFILVKRYSEMFCGICQCVGFLFFLTASQAYCKGFSLIVKCWNWGRHLKVVVSNGVNRLRVVMVMKSRNTIEGVKLTLITAVNHLGYDESV